VEENIGAWKIKLTSEEVAEVKKAVERTEVHGERYPPRYSNIQDKDWGSLLMSQSMADHLFAATPFVESNAASK